MKDVLYHVMTDREFDDIVKKTYGHEYNFVADNECINDSEHAFNRVAGNLHTYDLEELEKFRETGHSFMITHTLLNDMVKNGIIPSGDYLVTVRW